MFERILFWGGTGEAKGFSNARGEVTVGSSAEPTTVFIRMRAKENANNSVMRFLYI